MRTPIMILWFTLCCVLKVCVIVNGRYQVEVRLFGYNNPTGRCQACAINDAGLHRCCDSQSTFSICGGNRLCDSFFIYCLRPLNTNSIAEGGCSGFESMTSNVNRNDGPVDFENATVLGLPNPLLFLGLTDTYMGVQLYIEIMDRDHSGNHGLVDRFLIDLNPRPMVEVQSSRQNYSGIHGFATTELTINVSCAENFQESDCSQCVPGFTGMDCQTNIDDCVGVNCSGKGQCVDGVDSFNCSCDPDFTGELCQTNIDDCVAVNCSGNGLCVDGIDNFSCNCSAGYTGTRCEVNIDDCVGVNCNGNGVCLDGINSFDCNCSVGYSGTECEVNVDDCVGVNCNGNGECLDGLDSFTCECSPGYSGPLCDSNIEGNPPTASGVGGIIGGVLGAVLAIIILMIVLVVVVVVVTTVLKQKRKHTEETNGQHGEFHTQPAEGQVYQIGYESATTNTYYAEVATNNYDKDAELQRECENPIYGSDEPDDHMYTTPGELDDRNRDSLPGDREFENTIYGIEDTNAYSDTMYDTVNDR